MKAAFLICVAVLSLSACKEKVAERVVAPGVQDCVTAPELVRLARGDVGILDASSHCVARADYADGNLVSVTLTQNPKEIVSENLGPKDACFYGTYNETYFAGKTTLDSDALKTFGATFDQRCAQLKGKDLPKSTIP
jgi:hypothetical protein